ncbi:MAG TPA: MoaD/ThiS family protein [Candidatus Saccharimonadales bacterium]|nr:MoaD/ThiS family protein [Candidatus Saccharimonadales bacterium]
MSEKKDQKKGQSKAKAAKKGAGKGSSVLTEPRKGKGQPKGKGSSAKPGASQKKISLKLIQMGKGESSVKLPEGATVDDLLVETGLSKKKGNVLVNSKAAKGNTVLKDGATVVFATKVKGGRF